MLRITKSIGLAANVSGNHRNRAELAQRAGRAQHHAEQQAPTDIGKRDPAEHLPAARAQHQRSLFFVRSLRLHQRNQFARHKWERDEGRRQDQTGQRKDNVDIVVSQPGPEVSLQSEQQHEHQAGDDGRNREGQIDQRD